MRTEKEVLKDFEKLGWSVIKETNGCLKFRKFDTILSISKLNQWYACSIPSSGDLSIFISIQVHKLLTELFTIWGWLND